MTRLALAQFVFRTRSEAESYVDEIKPMAWPHVWYSRDPESGNWTVTAFIQADHLSAVA